MMSLVRESVLERERAYVLCASVGGFIFIYIYRWGFKAFWFVFVFILSGRWSKMIGCWKNDENAPSLKRVSITCSCFRGTTSMYALPFCTKLSKYKLYINYV